MRERDRDTERDRETDRQTFRGRRRGEEEEDHQVTNLTIVTSQLGEDEASFLSLPQTFLGHRFHWRNLIRCLSCCSCCKPPIRLHSVKSSVEKAGTRKSWTVLTNFVFIHWVEIDRTNQIPRRIVLRLMFPISGLLSAGNFKFVCIHVGCYFPCVFTRTHTHRHACTHTHTHTLTTHYTHTDTHTHTHTHTRYCS